MLENDIDVFNVRNISIEQFDSIRTFDNYLVTGTYDGELFVYRYDSLYYRLDKIFHVKAHELNITSL